MTPHAPRVIALLSLAVCLAGCATPATKTPTDQSLKPRLFFSLRKIRPLYLSAPNPASPAEAAHIRELIHELADIDHPVAGFSATDPVFSFAPLPMAENLGAPAMASATNPPPAGFVELVRFGPKALPFLLASLDDATPTRVTVKRSVFGPDGLWYTRDLPANPSRRREVDAMGGRPYENADEATIYGPANSDPAAEQAADRAEFARDFTRRKRTHSHTVTVGDVCFVIIGQIVNRPYEAVHYGRGEVRVNSPMADSALAAEVRAMWSATDPAQLLLDSLLADIATGRISYNVPFRTSAWMNPVDLQWGAATRLLYYFPRESAAHLADGLEALDLSHAALHNESLDTLNGVDLIKAVSWSPAPAVHADVLQLFLQSSDPDVLAAALPAMDAANAPAFKQHLEQVLATAPKTGFDPDDLGYRLLVVLGKNFGDEMRPVFENYRAPSALRRHSLCRAVAEVHGEWSVDLLGPMLTDTDPADTWTYPITPGQPFPSLPIRICDEAADTIAKNFPKLKFTMAGDHANLDRQITVMRDQIARKEY